jgi:urate oxidase
MDVSVELEGEFQAAYAEGDNRLVIATDTIKNTVYVLAKESDFASVEAFAFLLARHFVSTYPQVSQATAELTQVVWTRIVVDGVPHDHAFTAGGPRRRYARAVARLGEDDVQAPTSIVGGVRDLPVLKTTASEWRDFHSDRYRTLKDTSDRILATRIDADWKSTIRSSTSLRVTVRSMR